MTKTPAPKPALDITVRYSSIDGCSKSRKFKSLKGAQAFAQRYVGKTPEMGGSYAVSGDGVGKIEVTGVALSALFPDAAGSQPDEEDFS